jgi:hypothetical protein
MFSSFGIPNENGEGEGKLRTDHLASDRSEVDSRNYYHYDSPEEGKRSPVKEQ